MLLMRCETLNHGWCYPQAFLAVTGNRSCLPSPVRSFRVADASWWAHGTRVAPGCIADMSQPPTSFRWARDSIGPRSPGWTGTRPGSTGLVAGSTILRRVQSVAFRGSAIEAAPKTVSQTFRYNITNINLLINNDFYNLSNHTCTYSQGFFIFMQFLFSVIQC